MNPELGKSIAATFALAGFTVALISGLAVENPLSRTLSCAIGALIACYLAGSVIGAIASKIAEEHIALYKSANPGPGGSSPPAPPPHGAGSP